MPAQLTPQTSRSRAWYTVGFFMLLYCISFVDRYVLALLAAPISDSLAIANVSMGVLFGLGFGVLYAISALPIAHLIDRGRRVPLVTAGVLLWSLSTVLSGFSSGFLQLLLCRSGVAIGEAVLSPAAISMIGDLFSRKQRTLPTSSYLAISGFMQAGAFVGGGLAVDLATHFAYMVHLEPWRLTLVLVGAPGLLLAPFFLLTVKEPVRTYDVERYDSSRQALGYIRREKSLFGWMFVGMAAVGTCGGAFLAWIPALLIRAFDEPPANTGYLFGAIGVSAALVGALTWPFLIRLGARRGRHDVPVLLLATGLGITGASVALVGTTKALPAALCGIWIVMFGISASAILPPLIIQNAAPSRMRGRLTAINLMASSLVGLALGPPLAAGIADRFYSGPHAIGYAMTAIAIFCGPIAALAILMARRRYLVALRDAIAQEGAVDTKERLPRARESKELP